ncbi:MAG: hypothetical protein C0467_23250 [Planctomycetaceae bacterium]|nr:hypothetical protein [Planctomycetaceae bacterium]
MLPPFREWLDVVRYVNQQKTKCQSSDPAFDGGAVMPSSPAGCTHEQMVALIRLMLLHPIDTPEHMKSVVDAAVQVGLRGDNGTLLP